MPGIVAVVPAYNEAAKIGDVLLGLRSAVARTIVVDDGSSDHTGAIAREAGVTVVRHPINRGLGAALGTGLAMARTLGDFQAVVTFDSDGQMRAQDIARVAEPVLNGSADFAIGTRTQDRAHMPLSRYVLNALGNLQTWLLFGRWVSDSQSGLRVLSPKALSALDLRISGMGVSSEFIAEAKRHRWRIAEVSIPSIYTSYSMSKGQSVRGSLRTAWQLFMRWFKLG